MAFKITVLCISAILVQSLSAQCMGNIGALGSPGYGLAGNGFLSSPPQMSLGCGGPNPGLPTSGGSFIVTSTSPIAPTGIQVLAENLLIEGPLEVVGNLPLLGTVAVEGVLPSAGQASTVYSCGDGNVGILSDLSSANTIGAANYGPAGINAVQREAAQLNAAAEFAAAQREAQIAAAQREAQIAAAQREAQISAAQFGAAEYAAAQREAQLAAQREAAQLNAAAQFSAAQFGASEFAAAQREAQLAAQREAQLAQISAAEFNAAQFGADFNSAPCYL